jgi:hypothetical protein
MLNFLDDDFEVISKSKCVYLIDTLTCHLSEVLLYNHVLYSSADFCLEC